VKVALSQRLEREERRQRKRIDRGTSAEIVIKSRSMIKHQPAMVEQDQEGAT
jgi:hypothetical protein